MKILVTFYSRHNHTQIVGELIGKYMKATVEELQDKKDRNHLISWSKSAFDEELKTPTKIQQPKNNPKKFDLVIIGTPLWDGMAPAVRTYLQKNKNNFKKVAFFATFNASSEDTFYQMEKIINKKPIATLEIQDKQIVRGEHKQLIKNFCSQIKNKL